MKTKIVIPLMILMLLLAACGKREQLAKTDNAAAVPPTAPKQNKSSSSEAFTVSRNGQHVTIQWNTNFSIYKAINILRNSTGMANNRSLAASLEATSKKFEENLPDTKAYWYWLVVVPPTGKGREIGPLRAPPDVNNIGNYTKISDDTQFLAKRVGGSVLVAWDLPNIKYKSINIKRNSNPKFAKKKNQRTIILTTQKNQGDTIDKVPDAEADYWY